ncbi:hypothetical protein [Candidatus Odyssella acanthamoebae]|uniref:Uncharacterized protein n=1 Tax=Candidatus Odyssella acanthamoebae TaxID=91604 RepID=A0A077AUH5_9PROT|nr:hypothetical protein [Candidatus Paracaedibacter acanthamoebae]AIK95694.1 hypothetical protein ID47_01475 [Candidatus Paracaedibacter acanthamoebae]
MLIKNIRTQLKQAYAETIAGKITIPVTSTNDSPEQEHILNWFSRLRLLYGVPFNYLCADESLLPKESIRFFSIDNNWITALIDGAYSLGSVTEGDFAHDQVYGNVISKHLNLPTPKGQPETILTSGGVNHQVLTGFLLRSIAVSGWPKLHIEGFNGSQSNPPLLMLRKSKISPDILLCIFEGEVDTLQISTPSEGIHFGFDDQSAEQSSNNDPYILTLKTMDLNNPEQNGEKTEASITIGSTYYRDPTTRVVSMSALANAIQTIVQKTMPDQNVTAAEFGLQMTVGVDSSILTQKQPTNRKGT